MTEISMVSGSMLDKDGKLICLVVPCMDTSCISCRKPVEKAGEMFYALGEPYCGAIHANCLPFYRYDGVWPHQFPACVYKPKR